MMQEDKDLCKSCEHRWVDFPSHLEYAISHCEMLDKNSGFGDMSDSIAYPCIRCPFNSYKKK